jgi:hypothetical protein
MVNEQCNAIKCGEQEMEYDHNRIMNLEEYLRCERKRVIKLESDLEVLIFERENSCLLNSEEIDQ